MLDPNTEPVVDPKTPKLVPEAAGGFPKTLGVVDSVAAVSLSLLTVACLYTSFRLLNAFA